MKSFENFLEGLSKPLRTLHETLHNLGLQIELGFKKHFLQPKLNNTIKQHQNQAEALNTKGNLYLNSKVSAERAAAAMLLHYMPSAIAADNASMTLFTAKIVHKAAAEAADAASVTLMGATAAPPIKQMNMDATRAAIEWITCSAKKELKEKNLPTDERSTEKAVKEIIDKAINAATKAAKVPLNTVESFNNRHAQHDYNIFAEASKAAYEAVDRIMEGRALQSGNTHTMTVDSVIGGKTILEAAVAVAVALAKAKPVTNANAVVDALCAAADVASSYAELYTHAADKASLEAARATNILKLSKDICKEAKIQAESVAKYVFETVIIIDAKNRIDNSTLPGGCIPRQVDYLRLSSDPYMVKQRMDENAKPEKLINDNKFATTIDEQTRILAENADKMATFDHRFSTAVPRTTSSSATPVNSWSKGWGS